MATGPGLDRPLFALGGPATTPSPDYGGGNSGGDGSNGFPSSGLHHVASTVSAGTGGSYGMARTRKFYHDQIIDAPADRSPDSAPQTARGKPGYT